MSRQASAQAHRTGGRAAILAEAGLDASIGKEHDASWRPKTHRTSTSARCPGSRAKIDQALGRGLESLAAFQANPGDAAALKHARTHVHQAAGAIQMVGLDAVVAYTDEIERQLAGSRSSPTRADGRGRLRGDRPRLPQAADLPGRARQRRAAGAARLFPEYEAMQRARGMKCRGADRPVLPDLPRAAPKLVEDAQEVPAAKLPSYIVRQRRPYQRGLLAWLRGDEDGAKRCAKRSPPSRTRPLAARCVRSGGRPARCSTR